MKTARTGRSLFILEIAILLIFFIISAVICISLFIFSEAKNTDANDCSNAAIKAVTIADTIKSCKNDLPQARALLAADEDFTICYDENWNVGGEKVYQARISCQQENLLLTCQITFIRLEDKKQLYYLQIKEFLGEERT